MNLNEREESEFDNEDFNECVTEYKTRFPEETKRFSNSQLYDAVMETEDDMSDEDWREYFNNYDLTVPTE